MSGPPHPFFPRAGVPHYLPPTPSPNPNPNPFPFFQNANPNHYLHNPNFLSPLSFNPYLQHPSSVPHPFSQLPTVQNHNHSPSNPEEVIEKIERAVSKAHRNLLDAGESVSAWKVSQSALLSLQADSLSSLGFRYQDVPSLYRLMTTEAKVNAFIHCFVGVRRITSLHDLNIAICKNEGIDQFEELGLGPLLRHPLVQHYFLVPSDVMEIFKITSEEIIYCLADYMDTYGGKEIRVEEFLDFMAKKQSLENKERLGVRIQSLGMHISSIREARKAEKTTLRRYIRALKCTMVKKSSNIVSEKQMLDRRFNAMSERIQYFNTVHEGKHIRFFSSSSEDENGVNDEDDSNSDNDSNGLCQASSQNGKANDQRVSSCPYPSATEEMCRLGLKVEMDGHSSPSNVNLKGVGAQKSSGKKRKCENQGLNLNSSNELPKANKVESDVLDEFHSDSHRNKKRRKSDKAKELIQSLRPFIGKKKFFGKPGPGKKLHGPNASVPREDRFQIGDAGDDEQENSCDLTVTRIDMEGFITTWKETCRDHSVGQVFDRMLNFYNPTARQRRKLKLIFSSYPGIGLLNVAVRAIKCRMWDSLYDTLQTSSENGLMSPSSVPSLDVMDIGPSSKRDVVSNNDGKIAALTHVGAPQLKQSSRSGRRFLREQMACFSCLQVGHFRRHCPQRKVSPPQSPRPIPSQQTQHASHASIGSQQSGGQGCQGKSTQGRMPVEPSEHSEMQGVNVDDIIYKIATYFELKKVILIGEKLHLNDRIVSFRKFHDCEGWLRNQFSVKDFSSLGHGDFLEFMEKHISLHHGLHKELTGDLDVSIIQHQLLALLSQIARALSDDALISKQHISSMIRKQFPLVCFQLTGSDPDEDLLDLIRRQKNNEASSRVLFSVALLGACNIGDSLTHSVEHSSKVTEVNAELGAKTTCLGSVCGKDAIKCLLKAPMLFDLQLWSHWDLIFAPSLGPLVEWLFNGVHNRELSCIATSDGKLIRIEPSATVDEFLEAAIQGSSFQTAVKLLSLLSLYRGTCHVPLSLLKCYAQRAMEVIIKNSMTCGKALSAHMDHVMDFGTDSSVESLDTSVIAYNTKNNKLHESLHRISKGVSVASKFILNCVAHLPSEFRSFAADVLLSGLQFFIKDAPAAILRECDEIEQRIMLHDIGFSLGILEWINDYHAFTSEAATDLFGSTRTLGRISETPDPAFGMELKHSQTASEDLPAMGSNMVNVEARVILPNEHNEEITRIHKREVLNEMSTEKPCDGHGPISSKANKDASLVIESIRREEFGLDPNLEFASSSLLKKQHARLGRALHCLSQELYSQDSHFLLELVQNADDNIYPENVVPTLVFILQSTCIVVLNNEHGFSAKNIRALCDVGNSTKKGLNAGYIGQKGIGFKSVFRVTDTPEIHSNGFHVKFDVSEGQIGLVLPTIVSPCDINLFTRQLSEFGEADDSTCWNTCIVLPFKSKFKEGIGMSSIASKFSDLHPSLLLFLHHLQCIKFRNMLNDSLIVMRRERLEDGIVKVSHGKEKMNWLVVSQHLQASKIRPEVRTTEIAIAFTLDESGKGEYRPHLEQQPVFAFLPLRTYGLKFILQGDFVLPSSREEVDGDSAWNQWLLSEYPALFVSAERSFCALSCFQESPGKAVTAYMSFVPLMGEVHGFFSHLPHMIISKLRMSNCLLLEGQDAQWVPPCRVLRGWDDRVRTLLPEALLHQHLGLGFMNKDIILSDSLAKALGIEEYGPNVLVEIISSICRTDNGIKSVGLDWLSLWLDALYATLLIHSSGNQSSLDSGVECDIINSIRNIPFIPLSDGSYGSLAEGPIWLPCDAINSEGEHSPKDFPYLYAKLRTVNPALLSAVTVDTYSMEGTRVDIITQMLTRIGVQQLSAHDVIKTHIIPAMSNAARTHGDRHLMIEYLCFVIFHLQTACPSCSMERKEIIRELQKKAFVLTNHGYKCPFEQSIHFSKEFGNPIDINKLIDDTDAEWHELDAIYLMHPSIRSLSSSLIKWRDFFQGLGVTDFVQIIHIEKKVEDVSHALFWNKMSDRDHGSVGTVIEDWESPELSQLLSTLSLKKDQAKCKYLLEVLDRMWDDCFSAKVTGYVSSTSTEKRTPIESSFIKSIHDYRWIASIIDEDLHYPKDLFYDCEAVRSILGAFAPYAVPQVKSKKFLHEIRFKTHVTVDDALMMLKRWKTCETPFRTSIAQMSKFYSFLWDGINTEGKVAEEIRSGPSIFVPFANRSRHADVVSGVFLSADEVYWDDPTGCVDRIKELVLQYSSVDETDYSMIKTMTHFYPSLHDFFVNECGIHKIPPVRSYLQILLHLSSIALPSQAADVVYRVLMKWADDLKSGFMKSEDISFLKESLLKLENTVLPTVQDKWVSLHPDFGRVCWCDDEELSKQFRHSNNIDFLYLGELNDDGKQTLSTKVSGLMQTIGVPALSEVVYREAIFYGMEDCVEKASLVAWVLPYAQRYLYKLHPDAYFHLKQFGDHNLSQLQVVVVEKLFYKHSIKGCDDSSKKRYESSCLLQENTLYITRASDCHSIFLELSRFFFKGSAELHLANFLHMITTMAESGSNEEQIEFFIINNQKVPKLPDEEPVWSLPCVSHVHEDRTSQQIDSLPTTEKSLLNPKRKPGITSSWPPTGWKSAPDFQFARWNNIRKKTGAPPSDSSQKEYSNIQGSAHAEDWPVLTELNGHSIVPDDSPMAMASVLQNLITSKDEPLLVGDLGTAIISKNSNVQLFNMPSGSGSVPCPNKGSLTFTSREKICSSMPNENQAFVTGRLGELIAYKYFVEKYGLGAVRWVNEETETGLPYDMIIWENQENKEYVEVKATKSIKKDWFTISTREWQFAFERGDSFSIAHVVLADPKDASVTVFKNPVRLCQQHVLNLVILMSQQQKESTC